MKFFDKNNAGIIGLKCFFDESKEKNDETQIMQDISKKKHYFYCLYFQCYHAYKIQQVISCRLLQVKYTLKNFQLSIRQFTSSNTFSNKSENFFTVVICSCSLGE